MITMSPESILLRLASSAPAVRAIAQATLMIGIAGLVAALSRRASASTRHAIWLLGLSAALVVTAVSAMGPVIEIHTTTVVNARGVVPIDPSRWMESIPRRGEFFTNGSAIAPVPQQRVLGWVRDHDGALVVGLWMAGLLLIAARCIAGHVGVARMIARARPFDRNRVARSTTMHVAARVATDVRISDHISAPFTIGARRPVVLLPAIAESWSDERLRIVLVHELAHVARFDYVAQLIATAACAIYWFNPIVWLAASQMRAEAEQAADDRVLAAGVDGVTYASHLLELARPDVVPGAAAAVAVGMARSNRLERRFRSMLDSTRSRGSVPLRLQVLAGTAVMLVAVPLAGFRMVPIVQAAQLPSARPRPSALATHERKDRSESSAPKAIAKSAAPIVIAEGAAPQSRLASEADTTFEKTLSAAAGERLLIDLPPGGEVTIHAWDQPQVRVRGTLSGDQAHTTRVDFERSSRGVELRASFDRSMNNSRNSNRFEVWVPRRFDVSIHSAGGGISIDGVEGTFTGTTGGGAIRIENAKGEARLTTGGGEVSISSSTLDGSVTTGGGEAIVTGVNGNVRVSSGSGPVIRSGQAMRSIGIGGNTVTVSGGQTATVIGDRVYDGAFSMTKAGGDVRLDAMPNGGNVSTGGGRIEIGSSAGKLDVTTGGGDIDIARMGGDVVATTGAGDVTITVVNTDGTQHSVAVNSGSGTVIIDLPSNIDARFDLETAYTERHGPTTIKSDFSLSVSETSEWDGRNGTPRKFVRATGSAGSGRGLIRIRTVNGDVVIRRK